MMRFILIFTSLLVLVSCSTYRTKSDFDKFTDKFRTISFPLQISDSLAFKDWNQDNLIDTNHVKQYELITQYVNKEYPLKLQEYKCSRIGKYEEGNNIVLMYKTYTTEAGRGNPIIVLSTFTIEGNKKDEIIALWDDAEDPLYSQRIMLKMPSSSRVAIKSVIKRNGFLDGNIIPKKVIEKTILYAIDKDGTIKKEENTTEEIFIDDNPKILDNFPN